MLFRILYIFLVKSNRLVALATELGDSDGNETSKGHTHKVCKGTSEDTNENGDEDSEEGATNEHGEAVVVAMMAVVAHVVRTVVRVRLARAEAVRRLANHGLMLHGVVGTGTRVGSLVAAGAGLAHVLDLLDAVSHNLPPFAVERPLIALLV